jgi:tetratricopeptide (TPR) repeat protein
VALERLREFAGDKEGLSYSYNNLGNVFRNMADYGKALEYHTRALALKIELGNQSSEAYSHHNIGLVYFAMGDHANALAAYHRALAIRERLNDPRGVGVLLNAVGSVEALTSPGAALRTYERALKLRRQTGDARGEMATELNIGEVHRRTGDFSRATAAFERALALGDRIDAPLMRSNALKALSELDAARGDFAGAYRRQLQHQTARDKMFNIENTTRFERLQMAHEAERQQRQIEWLQQQTAARDTELAHTRTTRTALGVIALLVMGSCALLYGRLRLVQRVQTLSGLLPICAWCKKIRDDAGYWTQIEEYIASRSRAEFTHCMCPACFDHTSSRADQGHIDPRTA